MNTANNYHDQTPEKRCFSCNHWAGVLDDDTFTGICVLDDDSIIPIVKRAGDRDVSMNGICDKYTPEEEQ